MKKTISLIVICIAAISIMGGCVGSGVSIYNDHLEACGPKYIIYEYSLSQECLDACNQSGGQTLPEGLTCEEACMVITPKQVSLPYTFSVPRCKATDAREVFENATLCTDYTGCSPEQCMPEPCSGYFLPSSYKCQVIEEYYQLCIDYEGSGTIYVNGIPYQETPILPLQTQQVGEVNQIIVPTLCMMFVDEWEGPVLPNTIVGIPSSITITVDGEGSNEAGIIFESVCCYDCREKSIPAAILYPKVDIENFQIVGGDTIIQDGKIVSSFRIVPGTQQTQIQIENRGFFTQNEVMIRFEGLPHGITFDIEPGVQKIKAHNIGTYDATFTVDPNVPSGKYQVLMTAFSSNGTFDRILIEIVVP